MDGALLTGAGADGRRVGARPRRGALCAATVLLLAVLGSALAAQANAYLYWTNPWSSSIGRATVTGLGVEATFISGLSRPESVAVDGSYIYWADETANAIGRANLNGSEPDPSFITGASEPEGIAVGGGHIYWSNNATGTIGRADLNGEQVDQEFITGAKGPAGVAVDGEHIYWANFDHFRGADIGRAKLDGSEVSQEFITGGTSVWGVAVDREHVYWANYGSSTIGRASTDGGAVDQSFISVPGAGPAGVAVDGQHVFWAAYSKNAIGRANLDGSNVTEGFVTGLSQPEGLTVSSAPAILASPPSTSADTTPSWSFSGEPGVSFECRLSRGPAVIDAWEPCFSPQSFDLAGQEDGYYRFEVRSLDALGELSPVAFSEYLLDATAPEAPVFTSRPPELGVNPIPAWSFSAAPTEAAVYDALPSPLPLAIPSMAYAARSTAEAGELISLAGSKRYATAATVVMSDWAQHSQWPEYPAEGFQLPITLNIYAVDRSGATPAPGTLLGSVTRTFNIPWRPQADPSCPTGESGYQPWRGPDGVCRTNLATAVTFDLSGLHLVLPAEVIYGVAFNTDGHGAVPLSVPGPYDELNLGFSTALPSVGADTEAGVVFYNSTFGGFYADGGAGGVGIFRRDTGWSAEPAVELLTGDPPEPAPTSECRLTRGASVVSGWAACAAPVDYNLEAQPDGTYTVAVRETDAAGNTGPAASSSYTLDRSAPPPPLITARPPSPSSARSLSWAFTDEGTASFECRLASSSLVVADWASCSSPASFTLTGLPDGSYHFEVRARNALGTVGEPAADDHILYSSAPESPQIPHTPESPQIPAAPAAPRITHAPRSPGTGRTPSWSFTAESGALLECRLEHAGAVVSAWSACAGARRYSLAGAPPGEYRFEVRASDAAGNRSPTSFSSYVLRALIGAAPKAGRGTSGASGPGTSGASGPAPGPPGPASGSGATPQSAAPPSSVAPSSGARSAAGAGAAAASRPRETRRRSAGAARAATRRRHVSAAAGARRATGSGGGGSPWGLGALRTVGRALAAFYSAIVRHPDKSFFPMTLLLIVAAFLLLQGRIDKRDPKLALAPVYPDPDLEFPSTKPAAT